MKKILLIIAIIGLNTTIVAQGTSYTDISFGSKVYEYKKAEPKTHEIGIDRALLTEIVDLLGESVYSKDKKEEIVNKAWLAFNNPKMFDYVYKDFALKTNSKWGKKNAKGELVLEPNPYLTEWTFNYDEFPYFQIALSKILDYYSLITYGEDAESVKTSFNELLITKNINIQEPKDDDWAYSYIESVNDNLAQKGLVALVTKGHYDIIVCEISQKDKLTDLFKKMKWDFIQP